LAVSRQSYEEIYLFSFSPRVRGNLLGGQLISVGGIRQDAFGPITVNILASAPAQTESAITWEI
jgi:hypothetical protein